jgi:hypothetical protein
MGSAREPPFGADISTMLPKHLGQEYFSRLTWIFTSNRPGHVPAAQTFTLPSSGQP